MNSDMKKAKPLVAVDIDDVLAANAPAFIEFSNRMYGTHLTVDDYSEHWAEMWKVDHTEMMRRSDEFHASGHSGTYGVISGARENLEMLRDSFRFVVITSRQSSMETITREWLEKYYPGIFERIVFTGIYDLLQTERFMLTKADLAKELNVDYLIDDQLKHVESAAAAGIKCVLFGKYAWNRKESLPEGIVRTEDWKKVFDYLKAQRHE